MSREPTVSGIFDPRANGIDSLRLLLAVIVVYSHSYPLGGVAPADPLKMATGVSTRGLAGSAVVIADEEPARIRQPRGSFMAAKPHTSSSPQGAAR